MLYIPELSNRTGCLQHPDRILHAPRQLLPLRQLQDSLRSETGLLAMFTLRVYTLIVALLNRVYSTVPSLLSIRYTFW